MSTTSPKPSSSAKRLAFLLATLSAAAVALLLPQTQLALSPAFHSSPSTELLLRPAGRLLPGARDFWHTEGNQILDAHNHPIRIAGLNWSGFETPQAVPGGLGSQDYRTILRAIQQNGYNTVRLPLSNEMVEMPAVPSSVGYSNATGPINTDLRDLTSLQILDRIVAYSGSIGLKVILDNHRSEAGSSAQESGLWYTPQFPESAWIDDWTALARRYQGNATVIGMDLRNEPHNADKGGSCWDCGGPRDWHRAAERAGNAILAINPDLLIFVEGTDSYAGDTYWWGGNLEGVRRSPVHLAVSHRLVYSAHEYGPTEYPQAWFNPSTNAVTLANLWRRHWAYISEAGIAPVWIGEFGTPNYDLDIQSSVPGSEGQWFSSLVAFLRSHPAVGWTYWGVNGEDRYGLLRAEYTSTPANTRKAAALNSIAMAMSFGSGDDREKDSSLISPSITSHVETSAAPPARSCCAGEVRTNFPSGSYGLRRTSEQGFVEDESESHGLDSHAKTEIGEEDAINVSVHRAVSAATARVFETGTVIR